MTVKELKERLEKFDDRLIVLAYGKLITHVSHGFNEFDGFLFLDDYEEDDD